MINWKKYPKKNVLGSSDSIIVSKPDGSTINFDSPMSVDTTGNATFSGNVTIQGNLSILNSTSQTISFGDNDKLYFGDGNDLQIYHDGTDNHIEATSTLNIGTANSGIAINIGHTTSEITVNDNLTVTGDLTVNGTTTTINSTTLTIDDKNVVLASGAADSSAADGAGITVDGASATILYEHDDTSWNFNKPTNFVGAVTVGVNDTGHDVIFYGATSGKYIQWDESEDHLLFTDNTKLKLGTGGDLSIYHNGSNSFIQDTGTGYLALLGSQIKLQSTTEENMLVATPDAGVKLYYNNSTKLETYNTGAGVTGSFYLASSNYVHFDNGVTNDYAIRKNSTNLEFKTGGGYNFLSGAATFASTLDVNGAEITVGTNSSIFAENNIRFKSSGAAYIDHNTTSQSIKFRLSSSSSLDVTPFEITPNYMVSTTDMYFGDSDIIRLGGGSDLQIYHDGSHSHIANLTGNLRIRNFADDSDITFESDDGSGGVTAYLTLDGSVGYTVANKDIYLVDDVRLRTGTGGDFSFFHDGSNSKINNNTGNIRIENFQDDGDIQFLTDDGSGGTTEYFRLDGGNVQIEVSKNMRFADNVIAKFGTGGDLQIKHNATASSIENYVGDLTILNTSQDNDIVFKGDDGQANTAVATYFYLDGSSATHDGSATTNLYTNWPDNSRISLGTSHDLNFFHNGFNSTIQNLVGDLYIETLANDKDIIFRADDGSGGTTAYLTLDGSAANMKVAKDMRFNDNVDAEFGTSGDFKIYHDGSNTYLEQINAGTGNIVISNANDDADIIFKSDDGSGGVTAYMTIDGSNSRVLVSKDFNLEDSVSLQIGNSQDLKLYHHNNHSYIEQIGAGNLYIQQSVDDGDIVFLCDDGSGGVETYFRLDGGIDSSHPYTIWPDNSKVALGDSADMLIEHNGTNSLITNQTGNLIIDSAANDADIIFKGTDGGSDITALTLDMSAAGAATFNNNVTAANLIANTAVYSGGIVYGSTTLSLKNNSGTSFVDFASGLGATFAGNVTAGSNSLTAGSLDINGVANISDDLLVATATHYYAGTQIGVGDTSDSQNGIVITTSTTGNGYILFGDGTAADAYVGTIRYAHEGDYMQLNTGGATRLTLNSTGATVVGELEATALDINGNADISGTLEVHGNMNLYDADVLRFGNGNDLQIHHDGSNSYISDSGTGNLLITSDGASVQINKGTTENMAEFITDGAVKLYYDSARKFETTSAGIEVTGEVQGDTLNIDGTADIAGNTAITSNTPVLTLGVINTSTGNAKIQMYSKNGSANGFAIQYNKNGSGASEDRLEFIDGSGSANFIFNNGGTATFASNLTLGGIILDGNTITGVDDSGEFTDDDAHIMTSAGVLDKIQSEIASLVDSAPGTLNTLNELAAALGDDASFSTTVTDSIAAKLPLAGGTVTGNLFLDDNSGPSPYIQFTNEDNNYFKMLNSSSGKLEIYQATTKRADFSSGGLELINSLTATGLDINGNADISGSTTLAGLSASSVTTPLIQLQGDLNVLNKAQTSYITLADRDTSGSEVVYNLDNIGTISVDNLTLNGAEIDSDDALLIDAALDITIDAGGGDIILSDDGVLTGTISLNNESLDIRSRISNRDIHLKGSDDGSEITALTLDMSDAGTASFNHDALFVDQGRIKMGSGNDMQIYHSGSNAFLTNTEGNINIINHTDNGDIAFQADDGSGGDTTYLQIDGGDEEVIFFKDVRLPASGKLYLWTGHDANYLKYDSWTASAGAGMTIDNVSADGEIYLKSGNALTLTLDSSQNATFAGDVTISKSDPTLILEDTSGTDNQARIWLRESASYGVQLEYQSDVSDFFQISMIDANVGNTNPITALTINRNTNATFAGTIGSGAITSTGKITGTELEGTSLDINGNADISGNLVITGAILNNVENASLDIYGGNDATNDAHIKLHGNANNYGSMELNYGYDATNSYFKVKQGSTENFVLQGGNATFAGKLDIRGSAYNSIKIASNLTADTNKQSGIITENYEGNNVSIFQTFTQDNTNSVYYGSADGSYAGIQNHFFYVNADSDTAGSGHTQALHIASNTNATFAGAVSLTGGALSITGDGSNATVMTESGSGDFEINTVADIVLDAGGGDIRLRDDGTEFAKLTNNAPGLAITSSVADSSINLTPNGTGNVYANTDTFIVSATEGEAAQILLRTDEGDDNGDDWYIHNGTDNALDFSNDISGSQVNMLTLTPHATATSSSATFAGNVAIPSRLGVGANSEDVEAALTVKGDPGNTNQPVRITNSVTDTHTGLFLNSTGNAVNEKYGMQFGGYNEYSIGGIFGVMDSTSGSTSGDITIDFANGTSAGALVEKVRFTHEGNATFAGTISAVGASTFTLNDGVFVKAVNGTNNVASTNVWGYGLYEGTSKLGEISLVRDGSGSQMYMGTTGANQILRIGSANKVTALTIDASQNATFAGDITVAGDLNVTGDTITTNTTTITVKDPIIAMANNNAADVIDIGLYGKYVESSTVKYTGMVRDASEDTNSWIFFDGLTAEPGTTIDTSNAGFDLADIRAGLITSVDGFIGNVTGNTSGTAATVTGAAQSSITSLGTLTTLDVSGNLTLSGGSSIIDQGTIYIQDTAGGRIGFNRNTSNGNIHNSGYNAFQLQSNTNDVDGKFEIQAYQGSDGASGGSFYINKAAQPLINDYILHYGDENTKIGFSGSDTFIVHTGGTTALTVDSSQNATFAGDITVGDDIFVADSGIINLGSGNDMILFHDGGDAVIRNNTGHIYFDNLASDKDIYFRGSDGGSIITAITLDMSNAGKATFSAGAQLSGALTVGVNDTGHDVKFFGATAGSYMKWDESHDSLEFPDSTYIKLGTGDDFKMWHDGSNTFLSNEGVGHVYIQNTADDKDIIFKSDNGSGGTTAYLTLDGSAEKILMHKSTVFSGGGMDYGVDGTGADVIFYGDTAGRDMKWDQSEDHLLFKDNTNLKIGTGGDFYMTHNGTDTQIVNTTGDLYFYNLADDEDILFGGDNGAGGDIIYFLLDGSAAAHNGSYTTAIYTQWGDRSHIAVGGAKDMQLYHDGSNSYIEQINSATGSLIIQQSVDDGDIILKSDDGSGGVTAYLTLDGSVAKTQVSKPLLFIDNISAEYGTGTDMIMYHSGSHGYIENYTGDLKFINNADNSRIRFQADNGAGGVATYFDLQGGAATHDGSATTALFTNWYDNSKIALGNGYDVQLWHDGTNTTFYSQTGNLTFQQAADDKDIIFQCDDGSGGVTAYLTLDGSETNISIVKHTVHPDDIYTAWGNANDFYVKHNGTNTEIINSYGNVLISNYQDDGDIVFASDDGSGGLATYFTIDGGISSLIAYRDILIATDGANGNLKLGASQDLVLNHDGSHSYIDNNTGNLYIRNLADDADIIFRTDDGASDTAEYLKLKGSTRTIEVSAPTNFGINGTGHDVIFHGDTTARNMTWSQGDDELILADNVKASFGDSTDLSIYHDGSNSYIDDSGTGELKIRGSATAITSANGSEYLAYFAGTGAQEVSLYAGNAVKFKTVAAGIDVTGEVKGDTLNIDGNADISGNLTGVDAITASGNISGDTFILPTTASAANQWIYTNNTDTGTGSLTIQAGAGSSGYGGGLILYSHSHASKPGWVKAGISVSSGGKFAVNTQGIGGGTDVFTVDASGTIDVSNQNTDILFGDNLGAALEFKEGSNLYMRFITTNGSEEINFAKPTTISNSLAVNSLSVNHGALSISGDNANHVTFTESSAGIMTIAAPDDIILDAEGDITIDANGGDIRFKDGGTQWGSIYTGGGGTHMYIDSYISDKDIIFKGNNGGSGITALTLDMSDAGTAQFNHNVNLPDAGQLNLGGGGDLSLQHDGTNSYIQNITGDLKIENYHNGGDVAFASDDGSGGLATYFYLDGGNTRVQFNKSARFVDSATLTLGTSDDLQIYHDGTDSHIRNTQDSGDFIIRQSVNDKDLIFQCDDGSGGDTAYLTLDGSQGFTTVQKAIRFEDNVQAQFGSSNDSLVTHSGSNMSIVNSTGNIYFANNTNDGDIYLQCDDGSGGTTTYLTLDGSATKIVFNKPSQRTFEFSSTTDGDANGDIVYFGGTTSMTVGTIYHYKSDGTWEVANPNAAATSDGLLAVALGAASDTDGMLLRGMVTLDHDPGAVGDVLFLSAASTGDATATAPAGNGDIVRVIGYQVGHASSGLIWFNPDGTFVEVSA